MSEYAFLAHKLPLEVTIDGIGSLMPLDDTTPKEGVLLTMMLVCGGVGAHVDFAGFIKEHGLERHFRQNSSLQQTPERP